MDIMELIPETSDLDRYLELTDVVDLNDASVMRLADRLALGACDDIEKVRAVFGHMQANIPHTFDTDRKEVACKASDVIRTGHGICYAKANLVAALLRYMGIPTGFCYQKYRMEGTLDSKFVLHCFNAVYFRDNGKWARMDVRTKDEGFDPAFKPYMDSGIFPVDAALGEMEYRVVYVRPIPSTIEALKNSRDAIELHDKLPEGL
jgi:transglutaminase-like putative cysteine protease